MLIKVCGMFCSENISEVKALGVDMLGFIFYAKSLRNAFRADVEFVAGLDGVEKVAVFVNEGFESIVDVCKKYKIYSVQLHGSESVELIEKLKGLGYKVTKAISIASEADLQNVASYDCVCDRILLDTKCEGHGGSGLKFDWSILDKYIYKTPFMLSGGISLEDAKNILSIDNAKLVGVDINSRFEGKNNLKDTKKIKKFIEGIRQ